MKNLVISSIDLFGWNEMKLWATSLRESGYDGDAVVIAYRISDPNLVSMAADYNVSLMQASVDFQNQPINHNEQPHHKTTVNRNRFFHKAWYLMQLSEPYDWVISTDLRDVIFQKNPTDFMEMWEGNQCDANILASSEGQLYEKEPWNAADQKQAHGSIVWALKMHNASVRNAGVIAVKGTRAADLFLNIFFSCKYNTEVAGDQAAYNLLLDTAYKNESVTVTHETPWACQCHSAFSSQQLRESFVEPLPYHKDGVCYTRNEEKFIIVHQYDRIPELKSSIEARYGV